MAQENWNNAGVSDENNAYVTGKDWKTNDEMITSMREAESKLGRSITLPASDASEEDFNSFYSKIGRPNSAAEYAYKMPEGGNEDQYNWYKDAAHKIGLSDAQTSALGQAWDERSAEMFKSDVDSSETQMQAIKDKLGDDYDAKIAAGKSVVAGLGLSDKALANIEGQIGTTDVVDLFVRIGEKVGEGAFNNGLADPDSNIRLTKEQALEKVESFNNDEKLQKLYKLDDKKTIAYRNNIYAIAYD